MLGISFDKSLIPLNKLISHNLFKGVLFIKAWKKSGLLSIPGLSRSLK
jgi:hypothetical protein